MSDYVFNQPTYQPRIIQDTARGMEFCDIRDKMLANRTVEIIGEINAESASVAIRNLLYLQSVDPEQAITMYINSPGGEVTSGLAIYDVMQAIGCPINTVCLGLAASMASILFVAGDDRSMLAHSRVMVHDPLAAGGVSGSALAVKRQSDNLMKTRDVLADIICEHTGLDRMRVENLMYQETYFDADEAIETGLAERIVTKL